MTTPTPLPLDAAALDWLHDNHAHDLLGNHPQVIAQSRAALTLAARVAELEQRERDLMGQLDISEHKGMGFADRVAELERELAAANELADGYRLAVDDSDHRGMGWMARANALRDALEKVLLSSGIVPAHDIAEAALAAHPAASLAAHDAEVIKPYLKALRSIAANTCCDRCQEAAWVAKSALAAQAQEVKPHA